MSNETIKASILDSKSKSIVPSVLFDYKGHTLVLSLNEVQMSDENGDKTYEEIYEQSVEVANSYMRQNWILSLVEIASGHVRIYDPDTKTLVYRKEVRPMGLGEMIEAYGGLLSGQSDKEYKIKPAIYKDGTYDELVAYMPKKRSYIPADIRRLVYDKCGGHCAYCGKTIAYHEMQVDHVEAHYRHRGKDELDNYLPACRDCNGLKSDYTLDEFREALIPDCGKRARANGIIAIRANNRYMRIAQAYDLIRHPHKEIVFYFERKDYNETNI